MYEFIEYIEKQFHLKGVNPKQYSPLVLAYIGDSIYDVIIRTMIVEQGNAPVQKLHIKTSKYVKASAQSVLFRNIESDLTKEEFTIYKRGRNAKSSTVPKNSDLIDYRIATGLECLIGFLYLDNQFRRIVDLIAKGVSE